MSGYYLSLALRSFRRNKVLTALMVLTIAIGIGATTTTLTLYFVLSGDPIPHKSDRLFHPRLDANRSEGELDPDPPALLTRYDAEELLRQQYGRRQTLFAGGRVTLRPDGRQVRQPVQFTALYPTSDFFPMFDVPLKSGRTWTAAEDQARARVAVIGPEVAQLLFPDGDPIGQDIHLFQGPLRVIGVLDDWSVNPRFYEVGRGAREFGQMEQVFVPFSTSRELELEHSGSMTCWRQELAEGETPDTYGLSAPCAWLHYWVELDSPAKAADYLQYLSAYSDQQRESGRYTNPTNVRLDDVMAWLDLNRIVPNDVRLQMWLAFGFLLVCLVNTVGLLLAKFLRRSGEIGVRRALGASRSAIFRQCLVEAGTIGLAGGVLGTAFAMLGQLLVQQQPDGYARLVQMDLSTLALTFALAVGASLLAGLLPAWRAMQIPPALQLKSQ